EGVGRGSRCSVSPVRSWRPAVTRLTRSSSTRNTSSESFVCSPNQFRPPLRKPRAPPSTFIASAGPLGEFHNGCRELEYVTPTTSSTETAYSAFPFFCFSVTVTTPSATTTIASRSRRLPPSVTTAWASNRKGVVTSAARAGTTGAAGDDAAAGEGDGGFAGAFEGAGA